MKKTHTNERNPINRRDKRENRQGRQSCRNGCSGIIYDIGSKIWLWMASLSRGWHRIDLALRRIRGILPSSTIAWFMKGKLAEGGCVISRCKLIVSHFWFPGSKFARWVKVSFAWYICVVYSARARVHTHCWIGRVCVWCAIYFAKVEATVFSVWVACFDERVIFFEKWLRMAPEKILVLQSIFVLHEYDFF